MDIRDDVPDEVPVADAVEQQLPAVSPQADDGDAVDDGDGEPPLEVGAADWQEQHEDVIDPDQGEFDR